MKVIMFTFLLSVLLSDQQNKFQVQRENMVQNQLISRGISNQLVLNAMKKVPREFFVPFEIQERAYEDNALPIHYNQTISQPYIVAYMTEIINPRSDDIVLEIGTGSGYQAAILAEIVKKVYSIEIIPELSNEARNTLDYLGYQNIELKTGDGYDGWEEYAPFDAIIVTAAPQEIPQPLINQLKEGGQMIIPVGSVYSTQQLILVTKRNNKIWKKNMFPVRFVPFTRD